VAEHNVRKLNCEFGSANVVFITERVFVTVSHNFHEMVINRNGKKETGPRLSDSDIAKCYVLRQDSKSGQFVPDYVEVENGLAPQGGDPVARDKEGKISLHNDYTAGVVRNAISDIIPIELATTEDLRKSGELVSAAAYRGCDAIDACFTVSTCFIKYLYPAPPAIMGTSGMLTDCPAAQGTSGAALFSFKRDSSGKLIGIALAGLHKGGVILNPGGDFHYDPKDPKDPRTNWTSAVGFAGAFVQKDIPAVLEKTGKKLSQLNRPGN
jgi:hypothetical protein